MRTTTQPVDSNSPNNNVSARSNSRNFNYYLHTQLYVIGYLSIRVARQRHHRRSDDLMKPSEYDSSVHTVIDTSPPVATYSLGEMVLKGLPVLMR